MQWKRTSTRVNGCTEAFAEIERQSTVWHERGVAVRDGPPVRVVPRLPLLGPSRLTISPRGYDEQRRTCQSAVVVVELI